STTCHAVRIFPSGLIAMALPDPLDPSRCTKLFRTVSSMARSGSPTSESRDRLASPAEGGGGTAQPARAARTRAASRGTRIVIESRESFLFNRPLQKRGEGQDCGDFQAEIAEADPVMLVVRRSDTFFRDDDLQIPLVGVDRGGSN